MEADDAEYIESLFDSLDEGASDEDALEDLLLKVNDDDTMSEEQKERLKPKIIAEFEKLKKTRLARDKNIKVAKAKAADTKAKPVDEKAANTKPEEKSNVKPSVGEKRLAAAREAAEKAKPTEVKPVEEPVKPVEEPPKKPRVLSQKQQNAIAKQKAAIEETRRARLAGVEAAKAKATGKEPQVAQASEAVPAELEGLENTEGLDVPEVPEPPVESPNDPAAVNQTQQTLLRIGVDSASEYIELDASKFKSSGSFETLGLGLGQREFRQLYNMTTADEFRTMQKVFGVSRIGAKPKFVGYLDAKCRFEGIDVVKKAFKARIGTLRAVLSLNSNSNTAKRNKHFQEWLSKSLKEMDTFTTECPPEPVTPVVPVTANKGVSTEPTSVATGTSATGTSTAATASTASSACPCLTDINLLRDLVYVLALVQGKATPELKKQIAAIPMNRILNISKAPNTATFLPQVREALTALLRILRDAPSEDVAAVNFTAISNTLGLNKGTGLEGILKHLRELSTDLEEHRRLLKECQEAKAAVATAAEAPEADEPEAPTGPSTEELTIALTAAKAKVTEAESAYTAVQAELEALRAALATETAKASGATSEAEALRARVTERERELAELRAILATLRGELAQAKETVGRLEATAAEVDGLRAAAMRAETEKKSLQAQINALQEALAKKGGKEAATLQEQLNNLKAELAQVNTAFEKQALQLAAKNTELEGLRRQLTKLQKDKAASNTAAAEAATNAAAKAKETLAAKQAELDKSSAALASKEAELAAAVAQVAALTASLEESGKESAADAESKAAAAAAKLAAKETELSASRANAAKAKEEAAAQLAKIQEELGTAKAALTTLQGTAASTEAEKAKLERQAKDAKATIESLQAQLATAGSTGTAQTAAFDTERKALEAQITRLKAELASVNGAAETARRECASKVEILTAQLGTLNGQLANAKAEQTKAVEAAKSSAAADVATKLAQATTEHEAKVAELNKEAEKVKKELATATAALTACEEKDRIIQAKTAEIATLRANSDAKNAKLKKLAANSADKNTEIAGLRGSLAEAAAKASTGANSTAELAKLKAQLTEAQTLSTSLQANLAKLEAEKKSAATKTQEGLQTALAQLAITKEHEAAMTKLLKGDKTALLDIKRETCNFFLYLYDIINMQIRDIDGLKIPPAYKKNIFDFYKVTEPLPEVDKQELLSEMTSIFQEFFVAFQKNIGTTTKGFKLQREYPLLMSIVSKLDITDSQVCKTTTEATKLRAELQRFGHLYTYGIEPEDEAQYTFHVLSGVKDPFCDNTTKYVPLGILAIRFIQLVHETFDSRYLELKARCAPLNTEAEAKAPGGSWTPTSFEELEEEEEEAESQQGAARPAPCKRKSPLE